MFPFISILYSIMQFRYSLFVSPSKTNGLFLYEMQHYCRILESIEIDMNIGTKGVNTTKNGLKNANVQ